MRQGDDAAHGDLLMIRLKDLLPEGASAACRSGTCDHPRQTAQNWRSQGCKNYDDAHDVCLDKEGADPGWTNTGRQPDALTDKHDNIAWYAALNRAKAAMTELENHLDALKDAHGAQQTTDLRIGEIQGALEDCRNKLAELTNDSTVFPHF